ncbi:MAG TPA: hypothetical protein VJ779_00775 [Acetobacteraceae bacterium]|nr:hypothetical protein [Acetobacteraceae bacterium]
MTARSWIGGNSNDSLYTAADWSPAGTLAPGDTLSMASGVASLDGGNLAGDTLTIPANASAFQPYSATVNLSGHATLSALVSHTALVEQEAIFNVVGRATLHVREQANSLASTRVTENIAPYSVLKGTFVADGHDPNVTVNGADATARFANCGDSSIAGGVAVINADVVGTGSFTARPFSGIMFLHSVGAHQTVNSDGFDRITIGRPDLFQGLVNFTGGPTNMIDLLGITADSYSYRNDVLSLYRGGQVVDSLRLHASTSQFQVTESARGISITGLPASQPAGSVILPQV